MMPRGSELLLPVNPLFIWLSLFGGLSLNMLPWGRVAGMPDFLAVALVFWNVHQPRRVGVGVAFMLGLLMDVHQGALLGQHALAYTLLSFFAITVHRRLLWFTVPSQAVQIVPLFVAAHTVSLLVRMIAGAGFPGWTLALAPIAESLAWPLASVILLAPQRRAPDRDKNRPL
jgi:rod shape-determining protein MreD